MLIAATTADTTAQASAQGRLNELWGLKQQF